MIRHRNTFTPRELFSRMQGAWFEPRQGSMWQENTGVTPTTSGGQTIGKLVDLSADRVASQATAANRPLFGVRRNLLTYSQKLATSWSNVAVTVTENSAISPDGTSTANLCIPSNANANHYVGQTITVSSLSYTWTFYAKASGYSFIQACLYNQSKYVNFDLSGAGAVTASSGVSSSSIQAVGNDWYKCSVVLSPSAGTHNLLFVFITSGTAGYFASQATDGTSGIYLWGADLRLTADVDKDPSPYQRVTTATDYDTGQFPAIRYADSTDFMTVSLPAINVRRNLLTYSEQLDNAAWAVVYDQSIGASYVISTNVYAQTLIANSASYSLRKQAVTTTVGNIYTASIYIKKTGSKSYTALLQASLGSSKYSAISVNSYTGVCTAITGANYIAPSATPIVIDKGDCWRVTLTVTALTVSTEMQIYSSVNVSGSSLVGPSAGDNVCGGVQFELGSVATDYQKITDWTSEQYSSAGSVYFATPSGMSCLHNQSIGTTYNLPAPQTDIYGTVITPARLAPPLEQRLAQYMHRLAGLSDADFFWQEQATDGMTGQLLTDDNDIILLRA